MILLLLAMFGADAPPAGILDDRWRQDVTVKDVSKGETTGPEHLRNLRHFYRVRPVPKNPKDPNSVKEALARPWGRWRERVKAEVFEDGSYVTKPGPYLTDAEIRRWKLPPNHYEAD